MNENENILCSQCEQPCAIEDACIVEDEVLCRDCAGELTVLCEHCGERIYVDDNAGDRYHILCARCFDAAYTACLDCGVIMHVDNTNYINGSGPYCDSCCDEREENDCIHDYGYKPYPIFYGEGERFFGVELELDGGGKNGDKAQQILDVANNQIEHLYIKGDGSLDDGIELVTHPMTLNYHLNTMSWEDILQKSISLGYFSHQTKTCGYHIHVNRTAFGDDEGMQEACISRVLFFVERFWNELLRFSRRSENQLKRWAARYGLKLYPKEVMDSAKYSNMGRYSCVNICNRDTIEFRLFRGTLKLNTLYATLQLVDEICNVAIFLSDGELQNLSWIDFLERLDKEKHLPLITYLKERRLYLNEEVQGGEEF